MTTMPFLYLPDAVTLILLLLVLDTLRGVAVAHLRQELLVIRKEMILFRLAGALGAPDPGYAALRGLIDSSMRLAPRLSPGRLAFLYRLHRRMLKRGLPMPVPDVAQEVRTRIEEGTKTASGEKFKRLQTEMSLGVGSFFLMGSLSGWFLMLVIVPQMIKRSIAHHARHRTDAFFDMAERVLSRLGRRAQRYGFATDARAAAPAPHPECSPSTRAA